jgi:hypothetical protein
MRWSPMIPAHMFSSFLHHTDWTNIATWCAFERLPPVTFYISISWPMFIGSFWLMLTSCSSSLVHGT